MILNLSLSLLCSAYNYLANLACSSTPYQNTVVYPVVCVCVCMCVWIKSSSMVSKATTNPLKDNSCLYIWLCVCVSVCVLVKLVLAQAEQRFQ